MVSEYLENNTRFFKEGEPDDNGISYYFITLEKGLERVKQKAKELNIKNPYLLNALHYKDINHDELIKKGYLQKKYAKPRLKEKPRVAAIHLSHNIALNHFAKKGKGKWAMIFEEDFIIRDNNGSDVKQEILDYIEEAEKVLSNEEKPQLHYFGHCYTGSKGKRISNKIYKATSDARPKCRHSYIVNKIASKELVKKSFPMVNNGDEMWTNLNFIYFNNNDMIIYQDWQKKLKDSRRNKDLVRNMKDAKKTILSSNSFEVKELLTTQNVLFILAFIFILPSIYLIFINEKKKNPSQKNIGIIGIFITVIIIFIAVFYKELPNYSNATRNKKKAESKNQAKPTVTVILLNYKRDKNTRQIVKQLEKYNEINRIVVLNGKEDQAVREGGNITEYIDDFENNEKYGGARRFLFNDLKTDYIVFLDDDIMPNEGSVSKLVKTVQKKDGISGGFPRICNKVDGYKTKYKGKPDSVLIGFSAVSLSTLKKYQEVFNNKYAAFLEKTHGNCEDLTFLTYIRDDLGEAVTFVPEAKFKELDNSNGYSSNKDHYKVRDRFCKNGPENNI